MKILVIGASGHIGGVVADTLASRGHDVLRASRTGEWTVDITEPESVRALFAATGTVDAIIVAAGKVPFKHVTELDRDDYLAAFVSKALPQLALVGTALEHVSDGGSITLTTGVLSRAPIATGAAGAAANGAVESFVITAAAEAPRGIRINAVSPDVLENSPASHSLFTGHRPVTDEEVSRAYTLAVEGIGNGQVLKV